MKKEKTKKNNVKLDFGTFLLITGALANIPLWIGAFISTEAQGPVNVWINEYALPLLGGISGLAMAFTVSFGVVYVIIHLSKMQPTFERKVRGKDEHKTHINFRFYGALVALILLLSISLALLTPLAKMIVTGKATLFSVLGEEWVGWWSFARVAAADIALGAIALVHGVQLGSVASAATATASAIAATQSDAGKARTPKKSARTAIEMRECEFECGMSYRWPQGKGAHMKKHHPDLVIPKGIPVDVKYKTVESK